MKIFFIEELTVGNISSNVNNVLSQIAIISEGIISEVLIYNIKLGLWEVLSNLVSHGLEQACKNIEIIIEENEKELIIKVISKENHFDWEIYKDNDCPNIEQLGGRGIFILQHICQEFSYQQMGRIARMVFKK